jgi:hypothetical protein
MMAFIKEFVAAHAQQPVNLKDWLDFIEQKAGPTVRREFAEAVQADELASDTTTEQEQP